MIIPSNIDFTEYINFIGEQESQELHWGKKWKESLVERVIYGEVSSGIDLPWGVTSGKVSLRPAELSIWAGINGHKKSLILGQVMIWLARKQRVCIASLEMQPEATLHRMVRQVGGTASLSEDFIRRFSDWTENRVCIYDQLDTVEADRILGMAVYAATELDCEHIVIDSLTKCGLGTDDYTQQKTFVDRLAWVAKTTKKHIHLVCHMRKGQEESRRPGKFDVRGASEITDLADNVFICWSNKAREEAKRKLASGKELKANEKVQMEKRDQILSVAKQRHGEWEGSFGFYFDDKSLQFVNKEGESMPWGDL
jgi:twinkle protein